MMGPKQIAQGALFYEFSIEDHVPPDHLLRSIDWFVELGDMRCITTRCHMQRDDIAREITDHVATGNPGRQIQDQLRSRGVKPHLDIDEPGVKIRKADSVRGQRCFPCHDTRVILPQSTEQLQSFFRNRNGVGDYFFASKVSEIIFSFWKK